MSVEQDKVFVDSEGDRWFERNKAKLDEFNPETDAPTRLIRLYGLSPKTFLEVGSSNGARLAALAKAVGGKAVACEPSLSAIADGKTKFPWVDFRRGEIREIPCRETFDLVIVNFVLHWVDRRHLLRAAAEVDRVLADGGFLVIGDFSPRNQTRVPYHHRPGEGLFTYKQNYADLFLSSGLYQSVGFLAGEHVNPLPAPFAAEENRVGTWLLRKDLQGLYTESPRRG